MSSWFSLALTFYDPLILVETLWISFGPVTFQTVRKYAPWLFLAFQGWVTLHIVPQVPET